MNQQAMGIIAGMFICIAIFLMGCNLFAVMHRMVFVGTDLFVVFDQFGLVFVNVGLKLGDCC